MRYALFLSFFVPTVVCAQAPRITPRGDPSVRNDTIYRLAVDPAAHPEESGVILLDDGVVRYERDGRGVTTFRTVVHILKEEAAKRYQEQSFGYSPSHERLTVNWVRVLSADGKVISDKPTHEQESDVPAPIDDPVYQERKIRRLSLSGVAENTIVDYSYSIEELKPFLAGDFLQAWSVHTGMMVRRSRLIVDLPAQMTPRIIEYNLDFPRQTKTVNGRTIYTWATKEVPRLRSEMFAADSDGVRMHLVVSSPLGWNDIGRWYSGLARDRYSATPELERKVRELVRDARTRDDSIRAIHRWVAQDIRYVSISLGIGGYQPRLPAKVIETGYGDCKDKATLFVAALNTIGIRAHPVLLNSRARADRAAPTIRQFDHEIAAVETGSGKYQYVDLTSELTPYGELPPGEQGGFALVVKQDGQIEEVTLPRERVEEAWSEMKISGELTSSGRFNGRVEQRAAGGRQYDLRALFSHPLDSTRRAGLMRALGSRVFTGGTADSLVSFNGKDLNAKPILAWTVRNARATRSAGATEILNLPFESMEELTQLADALAEREKRKFPIDAEEVYGRSVTKSELRLTLPEGWTARLPKTVRAESPFGSYTSEYVQQGRELRVTRKSEGRPGIQPPDKIDELIAWLRAVAEDDASFIVLDKK